MLQTTSDQGLAFLASHEGIVPAPYRDSRGVLTWGVGHTAAAGYPYPASMSLAMPADLDATLKSVMRTFRIDVAKYEAGVRKAFTVPLKQHEFDAAVSFHYNTGAIGSATWVKRFNAGDKAGTIRAIMNWTKNKELVPRRRAERDLFAKGAYGSGKATVWGTDGKGRVIWSPLRTVTQEQLVAMMRDAAPQPRPTNSNPFAAFFPALLRLFLKGT